MQYGGYYSEEKIERKTDRIVTYLPDMAPWSFILCLVIWVSAFISVNGNCTSSLAEMENRQLVIVNETDSGIDIVKVSSEAGMVWSFQVERIHGDSKSNAHIYLEKSFLNMDVSNTSMAIIIQKPLDIEILLSRFGTILDSFNIIISCTDDIGLKQETIKVVNLPVNEFETEFDSNRYSVNIPENTTVGTTLFVLSEHTSDIDRPADITNLRYGTQAYSISKFDGRNYMKVNLGSKGDIVLTKKIDFDKILTNYLDRKPHFFLAVWVEDGIHAPASALVIVNIEDVDDLPPGFIYPPCDTACPSTPYHTTTFEENRGVLIVLPRKIEAVDLDTLNFAVRYEIVHDPEGFSQSFKINQVSGVVSQITNVTRTGIITIRATEQSQNKLSAVTPMLIQMDKDTHTYQPPKSREPQTKQGGGTSLITIIVAVVAIVIIIGLSVALFLCIRKYQKAAVVPNSYVIDKNNEEVISQNVGSKESLMDPALFSVNDTEHFVKNTNEDDELKSDSPRQSEEIYDGTIEYDKAVDVNFYKNDFKSKTRRSTVSNDKELETQYWITIKNENLD